MRVTVTTGGDDITTLDVSSEMVLEDFAALVLAELSALSRATSNLLVFVHNGQPLPVLLRGKDSLSSLTICDGDMLMVTAVPSNMGTAAGSSTAPGTVPTQPSTNPNSTAGAEPSEAELVRTEAQRMLDQWRVDAEFRSRVEHSMPELADVLKMDSVDKVIELLTRITSEKRAERERVNRVMANPMSQEAQKLIEDQILRENIDKEMEHAMEHMPEVFGTVVMLYVQCKVNGHNIKAFVDSGAQTTIMSRACAQRCGILRLVDNRFSGIAKGVGTQKIIGRIHVAQLQIESIYLPTSFTVLEDQSMDVLLGLDMLRRHQCAIDLKDNLLRIGGTGVSTRFLHESELPAAARHDHVDTATGSKPDSAPASSSDPMAAKDGPPTKATKNNSGGSSSINGQAASNATNGSADMAAKLAQLAAMGFTDRAAATKQLQLAGGDVNKAAIALAVGGVKVPGK